MPRCTFCKKTFEAPYGLIVFLNDGGFINFCSSKCRRNMLNLGRDNKKVNWTRQRKGDKAVLQKNAQKEKTA